MTKVDERHGRVGMVEGGRYKVYTTYKVRPSILPSIHVSRLKRLGTECHLPFIINSLTMLRFKACARELYQVP